jgi:hypothetical protein
MSLNKSNLTIYIVLIFSIIAFIVVIGWLLSVKFPIDYSNGVAVNGTVSENNARTAIQAQSVPTIVNGIVTSTSIIVAFSGALIGLFFREVFNDDKRGKEVLIIFATLFAVPFVFLFFAYYSIAIGGQFMGVTFLENAWRYALFSLSTALFLILFILLFVAYAIENPNKIHLDNSKPEHSEGKAELKIIIKNGDKLLEATGMNEDAVQKILQSWNANINPVNVETSKEK